eukprot:scaffold218778_cov31-Tisochrysis_lutea.AAC.3
MLRAVSSARQQSSHVLHGGGPLVGPSALMRALPAPMHPLVASSTRLPCWSHRRPSTPARLERSTYYCQMARHRSPAARYAAYWRARHHPRFAMSLLT